MGTRLIYLDNNATTSIAPEVREAMLPYLAEEYFNPSSMYEAAKGPAEAVKTGRRAVAGLLEGIDPGQIIFTSCATESNNAAIFGVVKANPGRRHVITTSVEHPAVLEVCRELGRLGLDVTFLPVGRDGTLDPGDFVRALRSDTLLVTIMHANNETGVLFPVQELSRIAKETDPSIVFHTDATQSVGKVPINLDGEFKDVDLLSLSGHKLHAPKGVGVLYIKRGTPWRPFMLGGHQERSLRAGTENVPHIVALGKACELAAARMADEQRIRNLRDRLESEVQRQVPCVEINGAGAPRLPNTLNLACHYVEGEGILYQLSAEGICASSGSACTSGSLDPSHVLKAMNLPFTAIHGSVRFSLSRYNTDEEIDRVIEVFPRVIRNLRQISPYWDQKNDRPRAQ
jgi:cysteine desulfurase